MLQLGSIEPLHKILGLREAQTFKIILDATEAISEDIEVKTIYIGSTDTNKYDQVLSEDLIGPIPSGRIGFDIEIAPINIEKVNLDSFFGLTSIVVMFKFRNEEFLRVGYFIKIGYPGIDNLENFKDEGEEISEETNEEDLENSEESLEINDDNENGQNSETENHSCEEEENGSENTSNGPIRACNGSENASNGSRNASKGSKNTPDGSKNTPDGSENIFNDLTITSNAAVETTNQNKADCQITKESENTLLKTPNLKNLVPSQITTEEAEKMNKNILNVINDLELDSNIAKTKTNDLAESNSEDTLDSEDIADKEELLGENLNTAFFIDPETIQYKEHIMKISNITVEYFEPPLKTLMDINWTSGNIQNDAEQKTDEISSDHE